MRINIREICKNSTNISDDNYVGIKYSDEGINVFFPLGYEIPNNYDECRKSIIDIIKIVSLSKTISDGEIKKSKTIGEKYEFPMNSFIWIISDYLKNGLYYDKEKKYQKSNSGKINWKKSLKSNFYISNNSAIILDLYTEKDFYEDNIITDIHAFCINQSVEYIGWLFGNIKKLKSNINEEYMDYYISVINKELIHTFDDRKKELLINIKRILLFTGENKSDKLLNYGTYDFHYVWESMIRNVFGNEKVEKYFPSSFWNIEKQVFKDSNLRPDAILTIEKDIYILDSKYYKYGITQDIDDLPHTDSVQKQITYGEYIDTSKDFDYLNIYNAFILPYNKNNNDFNRTNNIEYLGFSESDWKRNKKEQKYYEHVSLIFLDTKYLIDCYLKYESSNISSLIASIQEVIDTFDNKENEK